jgi:LmbE family N-acetylglucosaminyl deacetylase
VPSVDYLDLGDGHYEPGIQLTLLAAPRRATRILCLGAHCDEIEIGCGGTLLKWLSRGRARDVTWAVFSASAERERELRSSARRFLRRAARSRVITYQFRESFFPASFASVKDAFESLYEIPKYEGGLTTPNAYVPLTRAQAAAKTRALLACYASQRVRPWFRAETFEALMRLRAVESGSRGGWAEGFHISKINIA